MARPRPLRDAALAISLLTVIPTRSEWPDHERPQVAAWFPWVGLGIGLVGYAIAKGFEWAGIASRDPYLVAAVVVVAWALVTRLLHFDGLADVADGFWGSHDPARRLEIMADSRTGAFGATAVSLVVVLDVVAIGSLLARPHELYLLLVPVISRFSATAAAWLGTPAKPSGLGHAVAGRPSELAAAIGVVPLVGAFGGLWLAYRLVGLVVAIAGLIVALATPHILARRFGGVTGDVMGASVLITEVLLLLALALAL